MTARNSARRRQKGEAMKIKTNLRAGAGGASGAGGNSTGAKHTGLDEKPMPPMPPRCAGY
jgi:hypothetical protein